jgi:hypothetical protein
MNPDAWTSDFEQTDGNTCPTPMSCRGRLTMKLLRTLFVASAFSVGLASLGQGAEPIPSDSSKAAASDLTIMGDVQMIEGEFYFVKDTTGHQVRLHVNNETKLEDRIKVGDKIEARVTSEGHATSITLQIPQNGTAPPVPSMVPTSPQRFPEGSVAQ